jgi:hypothetical protein
MLFEETADSHSNVNGYPWNVATTANGLSFTIEHWVKFNDDLGGTGGNLDYINTIGYDNNNSFIEIADDGQIYYRADNVNKARAIAGSFPNDGQYHHVAIVYDENSTSGGRHSIYVDGVSVTLSENPDLTSAIPASSSFEIGRTNGTAYYALDGEIDELRFWSVARTSSEITSNMHSQLNGNEANLVAYYDYEEGSGIVAADKTGNGYDSTLVNTTNANWVTRTSNFSTNATPTDITLSANTIDENVATATTVGSLAQQIQTMQTHILIA